MSDKVFSRDWFLFLTKMAASLLCLHRGERKRGGESHSSPLTQVLRLGIALMTSLKLNSIITGPNEAEDELTLALVYTLCGNYTILSGSPLCSYIEEAAAWCSWSLHSYRGAAS